MTMSEEFDVIYVLNTKDPAAHLYEVTCIVNNPDPQGQVFSLPAWIPGSYMVRDFAKNIVQVRASAGAFPLQIEKLDKQTWRCGPSEESLTIIYEIYAWDLSVRTAHLDQTHAYFNGTSLFIRLHGKDHMPCLLDILKPFQTEFASWNVATTLPAVGAEKWGFGTFRADNYDELIDHPVEMGEFQKASFEACGVVHDIVFTGAKDFDIERVCRDLTPICEYHIRFFGEPAPYERYLFQVMVVGSGYGGLEHRSSTSLLCSRSDLPVRGDETQSDAYRNFLALCSHELFHAWNVKRIKPAVFIPTDLSKEVHTRLLWLFEGVTSYYDELSLVRCGVITQQSYLELTGQAITRVLRGKGRFKQSITESSYDAWTKFYKQDENAPNAIVSYYIKGALFALCLDLKIRLKSENRKSLDDVMMHLWNEFGQKHIGIAEDAMEKIIQDATGIDVSDFFNTYLYGTTDLPLADMLKDFGVELHLRAAESGADLGGKAKEDGSLPKVELGARTQRTEGGVQITHVFEGGAAHKCGLAAGDIIVAIDSLKVSQESFEKQLKDYPVGESVEITAFRRDQLMQFNCTLAEPEKTTCYLTLIEKAPKAILSSWLG